MKKVFLFFSIFTLISLILFLNEFVVFKKEFNIYFNIFLLIIGIFIIYKKIFKNQLDILKKKQEIKLKSILNIDKNSKLILVEFKENEYLIFSSLNHSFLVEKNKSKIRKNDKIINYNVDKYLKEIMNSKYIGISLILIFLIVFSLENCFAYNFEQSISSNSSFLHIFILISLLAISPALILMLTPFTRIVISLSILRHAIGLPSVPSNQIITALSIFMSFFIMREEIDLLSEKVFKPYIEGKIRHSQMIEESKKIITPFLIKHTGEKELKTFIEISKIKDSQTVPFSVLIPAFVCSEIKKAFKIGVMIYIPFVVIDLLISSILMSMGMIMLPPAMISVPVKILIFVMVDGWRLILEGVYKSFI
ncbi:MAG: flagellar type III secretion system pore protein FliP [Elusimicrobiales bacterium]|nr:flagellar type III secretion system pore protein FliP [Elusimicrobiales bacterium]